jgi:hypothetical protein
MPLDTNCGRAVWHLNIRHHHCALRCLNALKSSLFTFIRVGYCMASDCFTIWLDICYSKPESLNVPDDLTLHRCRESDTLFPTPSAKQVLRLGRYTTRYVKLA